MQAMLFVAGLTYAILSLTAEFQYAAGMQASSVPTAVSHLRLAARLFPLDYRFRKASALYLANIAVEQNTKDWDRAALPEVYQALRADPTSADLLHDYKMMSK